MWRCINKSWLATFACEVRSRYRNSIMNIGTFAKLAACGILPLAYVSISYAEGDLSRVDTQEIVTEMELKGREMHFKPNHLDLATGKAYELVLRNVDTQKHEFESHGLVEKIFTRKVEVVQHGKMLAEIKGAVREVEIGPGAEAVWYIVPNSAGS